MRPHPRRGATSLEYLVVLGAFALAFWSFTRMSVDQVAIGATWATGLTNRGLP